MLIQKASKHVPDTLQTLSKHHTDTPQTFKTLSRNLLLYFHTPKRCFSKNQVTRRVVGGWVGGLQVHIHATSWPNLQEFNLD